MISPMMTVMVLAVLWLIVVVPMLIKRSDDRAGERSVARFGGAMRALAARRALTRPADPEDGPESGRTSRAQVFVPGAAAPPASRKPVPAAMEAAMYPDRIAKADLSAARRQMMARRRRSLTLLILGTVIGLVWGVAAGGAIAWTVGLLCAAGLAGYLMFLRNQAVRDRERRAARQQRSGLTRPGAMTRPPARCTPRTPPPWSGSTTRTWNCAGSPTPSISPACTSKRRSMTGRCVGPSDRPPPPPLVASTTRLGAVAQSGSAPRSHRGGQGFESPQLHHIFRLRARVGGSAHREAA